MSFDRHQEIERAKSNPAYVLGIIGFLWRAFRYQPIASLLLLFGLFAAPGALGGFVSGTFLGAAVPNGAPMADKMGNWAGNSLARPIGATLVTTAVVMHQAQMVEYKQPATKGNEPVKLDQNTILTLDKFTQQTGGTTLVNYKRSKR